MSARVCKPGCGRRTGRHMHAGEGEAMHAGRMNGVQAALVTLFRLCGLRLRAQPSRGSTFTSRCMCD
eukprot:358262-Chlamydomonas_euryale.AAC.1